MNYVYSKLHKKGCCGHHALDDLYNDLRILEAEVDVKKHSINASQNVAFMSSTIESARKDHVPGIVSCSSSGRSQVTKDAKVDEALEALFSSHVNYRLTNDDLQ